MEIERRHLVRWIAFQPVPPGQHEENAERGKQQGDKGSRRKRAVPDADPVDDAIVIQNSARTLTNTP